MIVNKTDPAASPSASRLPLLIAYHAKFLRFLESRVGDLATAEDILQSAYIKAMERGSQIREEQSIVAWFYRILRNAITDHYRRGASRSKALEEFAAEAPLSYENELKDTVCACIGDVIRDLKPEYRTAIEQVDLAEMTVEAFAQSKEISTNNALVRLHRARKAVARDLTKVCGACAEHQCLDCTCRRSQL